MCQAKEKGGLRCNQAIKDRIENNLSGLNQFVAKEYEKNGLKDVLDNVELQTMHQTEILVAKDPLHMEAHEKMSLAEKNMNVLTRAETHRKDRMLLDVAEVLAVQKPHYAEMQYENYQLESKFGKIDNKTGERPFSGTDKELSAYNENRSMLRSEQIRQLDDAKKLLADENMIDSDLMDSVSAKYFSLEDEYSETHSKLEEKYHKSQYNENIAKTQQYKETVRKLKESDNPGMESFKKREEILNKEYLASSEYESQLKTRFQRAKLDSNVESMIIVSRQLSLANMERNRIRYENIKLAKGDKELLKSAKEEYNEGKKKYQEHSKLMGAFQSIDQIKSDEKIENNLEGNLAKDFASKLPTNVQDAIWKESQKYGTYFQNKKQKTTKRYFELTYLYSQNLWHTKMPKSYYD